MVEDELEDDTFYPIVPGHELAGLVVKAGVNALEKFPVGSKVGVGCICESCLQCKFCKENSEQMCEKGFTHTYNDLIQFGFAGVNDRKN
mmetsp:Transcript_23396/g.51959  ORF Transcript_23396/g.51959 Transcript_23396/m.51959 type:complete len:89 (-) Transcript_23396:724-990(-)|eukprot:CAMPEP_0116946340 /NCGR_PEP_ID=MMETSP0467-20121206/36915_1 /TAXON_ID=283647 /ORGANISM="Mesodinium pulex, Strain SPMC105" /LENGTH=88 /DNA_ID=CAMNT_0004630075 /DNA_START=138 /DNA_END=404 /DNA_ORIENTATION=-